MATVGYYDMSLGQGGAYQIDDLTGGGHTAVNITIPNATQLAGVDTLYVTNPNNNGFGAEYLANQTAIATAVSGGMNLVIFDRYVTNARTILPGGSTISTVRSTTTGATDINIAAGAPAEFTAGLNNASFDGGNLSSHGYVTLSSLPPGAIPLLTRANTTQIVAFTYPYGSGTVFYSTMPLDFYSQQANAAISPAEVLTLISNVIRVICFAADTRVMTLFGERLVQDLRPGDLLRVIDGSYQPLRWVGKTIVTSAGLAENPMLYPVKIAAGSLGLGLPKRDCLVSRQHRVWMSSAPLRAMTGHHAALVAAGKLVGLPGITLDDTATLVTYFHLLLDKHEVVWAEGAPLETLRLGPEAEKMLMRSQRHEIQQELPLIWAFQGASPVPILEGRIRKDVVERHKRSSLPLIDTLPVQPVARSEVLRRLGAKPQGIMRALRRTQRLLAASSDPTLSDIGIARPKRALADARPVEKPGLERNDLQLAG
jgi:hypothetical protein